LQRLHLHLVPRLALLLSHESHLELSLLAHQVTEVVKLRAANLSS
jgi:hypothetical protein